MSDHTKRTIRTIIQVAIALCSAAPTVAAHAPTDAVVLQIVAVAGLVTHYFYLAEKLPGFPAWLMLNVGPKPTA